MSNYYGGSRKHFFGHQGETAPEVSNNNLANKPKSDLTGPQKKRKKEQEMMNRFRNGNG